MTTNCRPDSEERRRTLRNVHYLTELPSSLQNSKSQNLSVEKLEDMLHHQLVQHIRRDDERFQEILHFFKSHTRQRGNIQQLMLTVDEFHSGLGTLNIFASREQAQALFDKFDTRKEGKIRLYDFVRAVRLRDFNIGMTKEQAYSPAIKDDLLPTTRGKRMFSEKKPRAETPIVQMTHGIEGIIDTVREKLLGKATSGATHSSPHARRALDRLFHNFDPKNCGLCTQAALIKCFHLFNYPVGNYGINLLMQNFGSSDGLFDYRRFVNTVYPMDSATMCMTSLPSSEEAVAALRARQAAARVSRASSRAKPSYNSGSQTYRANASRSGMMSRTGAMALSARGPKKPIYKAMPQNACEPASSRRFQVPVYPTGPANPNLDWSQSKFPPNF